MGLHNDMVAQAIHKFHHGKHKPQATWSDVSVGTLATQATTSWEKCNPGHALPLGSPVSTHSIVANHFKSQSEKQKDVHRRARVA